jgi:DNA-directed RNA polymerase subunit RPC12/RpoP
MGILQDLSKAVKSLFHSEREGDRCPRCEKERLMVKRERVYVRLIERSDYRQAAPFESNDSSAIYETRDQILCARCGYRGRAVIAHDDGEQIDR